MKQTKAIFITTIITLLTLGTVLYTSCKKDHCKTLNCQHGGTCSDGFCSCPNGYTGTYCEVANTSSVGFRNKTFSKVYLTVNGVDHVVDTGATLTFIGGFGDTLKAVGFAHGKYGINAGLASMKVSYPTSGTLIQDLNVSGEYFFLKVINNNPTVPMITKVYANYTQRDEALDVVQIYNDGNTNYIGYYKAYTNTIVRLAHDPTFINYNNLGLSGTINQSYTAIFP